MNLSEVLIDAARDGDMFALKTALESGADINAKDNIGRTALMPASIKGYEDIESLLKNAGAREDDR